MANNFIEDNNKEKLKSKLDFDVNQEEIKWTEPNLDKTKSDNVKDIFFNPKETKKIEKKKKNKTSKFSVKPKILSEKRSQPFFEKVFAKFKKGEAESFQEQKKILSEHQDNIEKENKNKKKEISKDKEYYKDIGEVVKEKLKENKINISDGHTLKTNLMDGEPTILVDWKKNFLFLGLALFVVALVIGVLYAFLLIKKNKGTLEGENLDHEINAIQTKIDKEKLGLADIDKFQKKLLISKNILDKHIYWTNFFKFLEENTLENVYYLNGISGDAQGEYSFEALTDNYKNISEQLLVLENNDLVLEVKTSKGSLEAKKSKSKEEKNIQKEQIKFDLFLKLSPEVFYK